MWHSSVKMLRFIQWIALQRSNSRSRLWFYTILIALIVAMLYRQVVAETTDAPLANNPAPGGFRHGIVTTKSKLRAFPSMQSEVIGIAKEGSQVQILMETESWYHVRVLSSMDAWIYRSLVHIESEPLKAASNPPIEIAPSDLTELLFASAAKVNVSINSAPGNSSGLLGLDASAATLIDEASFPPETFVRGWFIKMILPPIRSPGAYVIGALIIVLLLAIILQLRGARQLGRAMQEIGQILAILEEMYSDASMTPVREGGATIPPTAVKAATEQSLDPRIEPSAVEQAVLDTLSDQCSLQESGLEKILDEKGYAGTRVKTVIGAILRKSGRQNYHDRK